MAVRRPPAPHPRALAAAPAPVPVEAPAPTEPPAPVAADSTAGIPSDLSADTVAVTVPAPATAPALRSGRRTVLVAGAAMALLGAVGAGALLRPGTAGPSAAPAVHFGDLADVPGDHPAAAAMDWAHSTGVQPALTDTEYGPEVPVDRGDVAVALHRLAGAPAVELGELAAPFADLGDDPVRVSALLWLHGRGALWGDAALQVHPEEPATRDCAAMMLAALVRPPLAGVGVTWDASADASLPQADGPDSAGADVAWLEASGMAPADLAARDGDAVVTRAGLALSLHRADEVIAAALA